MSSSFDPIQLREAYVQHHMRFREIAEGVASLRNQQQKERSRHENTLELESKIHARMDGCHRELGAQIRAIVGGASNGRGLRLAAKA
ncbi:MAG: hypothetical protein WCC37_15540 [Candidatus Sulfotelmatobacter sp.]